MNMLLVSVNDLIRVLISLRAQYEGFDHVHWWVGNAKQAGMYNWPVICVIVSFSIPVHSTMLLERATCPLASGFLSTGGFR